MMESHHGTAGPAMTSEKMTDLFSLWNEVVQYSCCVEQSSLPQLIVCIQLGMLPPYPVRTSSLNNVVEFFLNQERLPEEYIEILI